MFRFASTRAARGLIARVAARRMASQATASAANPNAISSKSVLAAIATAGLATAWIVKDGGVEYNKISNGEKPVKKEVKATAAKGNTPSFKNLKVTNVEGGGFIVEYDNDDNTVHYFYQYDKKGATITEKETAIVVPEPEPTPLPQSVIDEIAALKSQAEQQKTKIQEFEAHHEQQRQQEENAKKAAQQQAQHSLKLVYFPIRGRAEAIRLLLVDNGIPFDDVHVQGKSFEELKPTLHFGQVPVLYDNNVQIPQSNAILRHLGNVFNLNGNNKTETAILDFFNEGVEDVRNAYLKVIYQAYDTKDSFVAGLPKTLAPLNSLLTGDYIVGNKPQFADYSLFEVLDTLLILNPLSLDQSANLKAFHKRMSERPNIASYLASEKHLTTVNGNGKQ